MDVGVGGMAVLTNTEISEMWRDVYSPGRGKAELKASGLLDRAGRNTAFQNIEDAIVASGLDLNTLVSEQVETDAAAQVQKDSLDAGNVPVDLVPVVNFYLEENPPAVTHRTIDEMARDVWIAANTPLFQSIPGTPPAVAVMVRAVLNHRIAQVV